MTTITVTPQSLRVEFTRTEKWTGFLRDLDVDRRDIASVKAVPDGLAAAHGLRAPGLGIPGVRKIGNWWRTGGRHTLVSVRHGQPALSIELVGGRRSLPRRLMR